MSLESVSKADREAVRIVLADADRQLRSGLRQALMYAGFKTVIDVADEKTLRHALDETPPDLLLVAARLPDGDGAALVRSVRHSRCGRNPFLSIIMTAWPEEADDLGRLINCGTDHIVLKPVAPRAVFERMQAIIERRKPFVATATYLGPDRRSGARAEEEHPIPTFAVPNTLKLRAHGRSIDQATLQRAIDTSLDRLNEEMVRRLAFQIVFLVERAAPLLSQPGAATPPTIAEIGVAAQELMRRLAAGSHAHVAHLCRTLDGHLAAALGRAAEGAWDPHDLLVLRKLGQAIYVGLHADADLAALSRQVADAVEAFQARQRRRGSGAA